MSESVYEGEEVRIIREKDPQFVDMSRCMDNFKNEHGEMIS
jgi:hypothetical protein